MKFGGSSVATADSWAIIAGLVRSRIDAGLKPLVVHSAIAGMSNALEALLLDCVSGDPAGCLQDIKSTHLALAHRLYLYRTRTRARA